MITRINEIMFFEFAKKIIVTIKNDVNSARFNFHKHILKEEQYISGEFLFFFFFRFYSIIFKIKPLK